MLKLRKSGLSLASALMLASLLVVGFLSSVSPISAIAAVRTTSDDEGKNDWPAVTEPVNLAILIQDDLIGNVSNQLKMTKDFIKALPQGSQVMVGYITTGTLQVRQPFTTDLQKAAGSLRIVASSTAVSPYNPYVEVIEALRKFDSKSGNRNAILLISDGLDVSRGFDASTVLFSVDLNRAIKEANKRKVSVYSFYAPSVGLTGGNRLAASYGQSSLNRISKETGGKAFFQGTTGFVTFDAHFKRFAQALNEQETSGE
jgi:hypothetical protein